MVACKSSSIIESIYTTLSVERKRLLIIAVGVFCSMLPSAAMLCMLHVKLSPFPLGLPNHSLTDSSMLILASFAFCPSFCPPLLIFSSSSVPILLTFPSVVSWAHLGDICHLCSIYRTRPRPKRIQGQLL
jgi:hypothetical protein